MQDFQGAQRLAQGEPPVLQETDLAGPLTLVLSGPAGTVSKTALQQLDGARHPVQVIRLLGQRRVVAIQSALLQRLAYGLSPLAALQLAAYQHFGVTVIILQTQLGEPVQRRLSGIRNDTESGQLAGKFGTTVFAPCLPGEQPPPNLLGRQGSRRVRNRLLRRHPAHPHLPAAP